MITSTPREREADDAVQEAWLRFSRAEPSGVANLGGWLTTGVAGVPEHAARAHVAARGAPGRAPAHPVVRRQDGTDPEQQALLAEGVGLALLVVLDTLAPADRRVWYSGSTG